MSSSLPSVCSYLKHDVTVGVVAQLPRLGELAGFEGPINEPILWWLHELYQNFIALAG